MLILKPLSIDWSVAGARNPVPAVIFIAQAGLTTHELAYMLDSLVRVSRRVEESHLVISKYTHEFSQIHSHTHDGAYYQVFGVFFKRALRMTSQARCIVHIQIRLHCNACAEAANLSLVCNNLAKSHWLYSLPFQQFQALLTLFSKFFSSFPHGTCLLSVSNQYLALDETYHPVCAPISRSVTLETYTVHRGLQTTSRTLTIADALFQEAFICTSIDWTFSDYKSRPTALISMLSLSLFIRHY